MIIRAADKPLQPGCISFWSDAVFAGEPIDDLGSQRTEEPGRQAVEGFRPGAILYLESVAEQNGFFNVFQRQRTLSSVRPVLRTH